MVCTYCGNSYCWDCGKSIKGYAHFQEGGCGAKIYPDSAPEAVHQGDNRDPAAEAHKNLNKTFCILILFSFVCALTFAWFIPAYIGSTCLSACFASFIVTKERNLNTSY
jgi:hypothetical protein